MTALADYDCNVSKCYSFSNVRLTRTQVMNTLGLLKKKRPRDIIYGKTMRELKPEVEKATKTAVVRMFAKNM